MKEDLILKDYQRGLSAIEVSKLYNLKPAQVYYILKKNKVKARSNKENSRKYKIDLEYFKDIDTEEKAYWLGFIFADGTLGAYGKNKNEYTFKLDLSLKDLHHLEKFNKSTSSNHPIKKYVNKSSYSNSGFVEYCRVVVRSEIFCKNLIDKGCVPNKTTILKPPNLRKDLIRHFIRGYVDGDGSIKKQKNMSSGYSLGICGTKEMLEWINHNLPNPGPIHSNRSIFGTTCNFENIKYLYDNSNISLERKYERYLEIP